jgi:hypothetical protein
MNSIKREQATRKKARDILEQEGWKCWWPIRMGGHYTFKNSQTDIFGMWDLIAIPMDLTLRLHNTCIPAEDGKMASLRFIQLKTNHTGKIDDKYFQFARLRRVTHEYWSYNTEKRKFTRVILEQGKNYLKQYGQIS